MLTLLLTWVKSSLSPRWIAWALLVTLAMASVHRGVTFLEDRGYHKAQAIYEKKEAARLEAEKLLQAQQTKEAAESANEVQRYAQKALDRARGGADALHASDGRLSERARAVLGSCPTVAGSPGKPEDPAPDPIGVFADVLGELDRRAAIYAVRADELAIQQAGLVAFAEKMKAACERSTAPQ